MFTRCRLRYFAELKLFVSLCDDHISFNLNWDSCLEKKSYETAMLLEVKLFSVFNLRIEDHSTFCFTPLGTTIPPYGFLLEQKQAFVLCFNYLINYSPEYYSYLFYSIV